MEFEKIVIVIFVFGFFILGFISAKITNEIEHEEYMMEFQQCQYDFNNYKDIQGARILNMTHTISILANDVKNFKCPSYNISCPSYDDECPDCDPKIYVDGCYDYFENIIYSNAEEKEYVLDEYDCDEFSSNTAEELNNLGWDASVKIVDIDCTKYGKLFNPCGKHAIVQVKNIYVEATTGHIIHPDDYEMYGIEQW